MKNKSTSKIIDTMINFKKTAYHHYGPNVLSIPKFIYHSFLKVNKFIVVGFDLEQDIPDLKVDKEFQISKPSMDQLEKLRKGKNLPREFYYDRFHGISNCYIAQSNGELAYIHWLYVKGDHNRFLRLSDDVVELNYNTTLPQYRGKRLMAKVMTYIFHDLKNSNYKMVVGVVNKDNPAAIKSCIRAGFKKIGEIKTIGPFNKKMKV